MAIVLVYFFAHRKKLRLDIRSNNDALKDDIVFLMPDVVEPSDASLAKNVYESCTATDRMSLCDIGCTLDHSTSKKFSPSCNPTPMGGSAICSLP
jgi:hypothetical protein